MKKLRNGKTLRTRAEWEQIIGAFERSGLTQEAFCQRESIAAGSLSTWRRKLTEEHASGLFMELPMAPSPGRSAPAEKMAWDVELDLGAGMILRLRRA